MRMRARKWLISILFHRSVLAFLFFLLLSFSSSSFISFKKTKRLRRRQSGACDNRWWCCLISRVERPLASILVVKVFMNRSSDKIHLNINKIILLLHLTTAVMKASETMKTFLPQRNYESLVFFCLVVKRNFIEILSRSCERWKF